MALEERDSEEARRQRVLFETLLDPVWIKLSHFCHAVSVDRDTACDLMGETLLVAFQNFGKLRNRDAFTGFLFGIAFRVNRRWRAKGRREIRLDIEIVEMIGMEDLSSERSLAAQELRVALEKLPEKQREAVILFDISGLTLEEVREVQSGTLSGVKSRIVRGRAELRQLLEEPLTTPKSKHPSPSVQSRKHDVGVGIPLELKL